MSEAKLYKPDLSIRLIFSLGIIAVLVLWLVLMFLIFGGAQLAVFMGLFGAYFAPGFGKESIIPLLSVAGCPLWAIVSGVVILDMVLAVLIAFNFDLLLKVPLLGRALTYFTTKTATLLQEHRWIARLEGVGLFLFMYIPFMGSSAINTALIGRILAVHPKILLPIIFAGSVCATLTVTVGIKAIINLWVLNPWYAVAAAVLLATVVFVCWKLWRKHVVDKFARDRK